MDRGITLASLENDENTIDIKGCETSLKRFFSKRVRGRSDVDDLVQESLIRFLGNGHAEKINQPFSYLFRIANNLLIDQARHNAIAAPVLAALQYHDQTSFRADQEDRLHLEDLRAALESALDELPPKCREAFILRRFHDMDTPAIAARLNVSHRMVQKYLIRAMDHLHQRLKQREDYAS